MPLLQSTLLGSGKPAPLLHQSAVVWAHHHDRASSAMSWYWCHPWKVACIRFRRWFPNSSRAPCSSGVRCAGAGVASRAFPGCLGVLWLTLRYNSVPSHASTTFADGFVTMPRIASIASSRPHPGSSSTRAQSLHTAPLFPKNRESFSRSVALLIGCWFGQAARNPPAPGPRLN